MKIEPRTAIILAKYLEDKLTHSKIDDIAQLLDISPNFRSIASKRKKLSELIELISDDLYRFLEFLNLALEECDYIEEETINNMNIELERYGIKIIKNDNEHKFKAILTFPENSIQYKENKVDYLLPPEIIEELKQAWELYKEGKFANIPPLCRNILEEFALSYKSKYKYTGKYKEFIDTLEQNNILGYSEKNFMKKIYDYLSSFKNVHAGKPPNKYQACYIIMITECTIWYLFNILEKY